MRIGVLTPHGARGPEAEFPAIAPGLIETGVTRVTSVEGADVDANQSAAMRAVADSRLDEAAEAFASGGFDAIGYASTSYAYAAGFAAKTAMVSRLSRRSPSRSQRHAPRACWHSELSISPKLRWSTHRGSATSSTNWTPYRDANARVLVIPPITRSLLPSTNATAGSVGTSPIAARHARRSTVLRSARRAAPVVAEPAKLIGRTRSAPATTDGSTPGQYPRASGLSVLIRRLRPNTTGTLGEPPADHAVSGSIGPVMPESVEPRPWSCCDLADFATRTGAGDARSSA